MGRNSGTGGRGRRPGTRRGAATVAPTNEQRIQELRDYLESQGLIGQSPPAAAQAPTAPTPPSPGTGVLGASTVRRTSFGDAIYSFTTASGSTVRLNIGSSGGVDFEVNGSYTRGSVVGTEANAITLRLMKHIREDVKTRPEGFIYSASAATGDGYGAQRAMAYEAIGMSRPLRASYGNTQSGVVRNGKLRPNIEKLQRLEGDRYESYNIGWQTMKNDYRQERIANR